VFSPLSPLILGGLNCGSTRELLAPAGGGRPELATASPWLTSDSRRRPPPPFWQGDGGQKGTPAAAVPPLPQARGDGLECWRPVEHLARLRGR